MPGTESFSVLLAMDGDAQVRAACERSFPGTTVEHVAPDSLSRLPSATALIARERAYARIARAVGFVGGVVVVGVPADDDDRAAMRAQGIEFADPSDLPGSLTRALEVACNLDEHGVPRLPDPPVARSRRLLAAGELALGLQHAFNNPLAALMTEVQLLQLEAPTPGVRESAERMLDLVRRLTEIARTLDAVRDRIRSG